MLVPSQAAISRPKPSSIFGDLLGQQPLGRSTPSKDRPSHVAQATVRSPGEPEARASGQHPTLQRDGSFPVALQAPGGFPGARKPQQVQA